MEIAKTTTQVLLLMRGFKKSELGSTPLRRNYNTHPTTTDDNNGKSTIQEDSDEKHYYYGHNILRQLIYLGTTHLYSCARRILLPPWLWICIFLWQWLMRGTKGSASNTSKGGGAGGSASPVLLLSGGWIGIPSKIGASCLLSTSVLRLALVNR